MKTIILIGAGHANLEFLQALTFKETSVNKFIMISPMPVVKYSGLIPRLIMGEIEPDNLTIHAKHFAQNKGVEYIETTVSLIDYNSKIIHLNNGQILGFDIISEFFWIVDQRT